MITAGLRRAILAAAGRDGAEDGDPLLRPGLAPGSYASSLPFRLARPGQDQREVAAALAGRLACEPWIATAEVGGRGFLTVTVTDDALAGLAVRIAQTGSACAQSDALRGHTVPAAPPGPLAAPDWPQARAALAAQLTARLAAAAGATVFLYPERSSVPAPAPLPPAGPAGPSAPPPITRPIAQPIARPIARPIALPGDGPWRRRRGTPEPTRCGSRWPGCRPAASPPTRRLSRGMSWPIPPMLFGTRMPPLPPCCAGPPRWGPGQPGSRRACSPNLGAGAARRVVLAPGTGGHGGAPRTSRRVRRVPGGAGSTDD